MFVSVRREEEEESMYANELSMFNLNGEVHQCSGVECTNIVENLY